MELVNLESPLFLIKIVVHDGHSLIQHLNRALEHFKHVSHPLDHLFPVLALDLMLLQSLWVTSFCSSQLLENTGPVVSHNLLFHCGGCVDDGVWRCVHCLLRNLGIAHIQVYCQFCTFFSRSDGYQFRGDKLRLEGGFSLSAVGSCGHAGSWGTGDLEALVVGLGEALLGVLEESYGFLGFEVGHLLIKLWDEIKVT